MTRILIVEDEADIQELLDAYLRDAGYDTALAGDGIEAAALFQRERFDLVLLDVMLPGLDGFAVKNRLPDTLPVIFVTARTNLTDKLRGLGLGAEDYIVKPFEILELLARVETVLRRAHRGEASFRFHDLNVDLAARRVLRAGREVPLTPQEYALLETLVVNRNLALSRDKLLEIAWGYDYQGETRTVDMHVKALRQKLGEDVITTVRGVGYKMT